MGIFHFSSTIGAKHARICSILSLLHTLITYLHKIKKKKYDLPMHQKSQVCPGTLTVVLTGRKVTHSDGTRRPHIQSRHNYMRMSCNPENRYLRAHMGSGHT